MKKRPGPGEITSQLGSFLRTTWKQLDPVKDFVVQKSGEARREIDLALVRRKRKQALAELGEATFKLVEAGRIDDHDFPELSDALARLSELEEQLAGQPPEPPREPAEDADFVDESDDSDDEPPPTAR